jgi:large subunit ribosomal protein L10
MTTYSGVPVKELENLRRNIREVGGKFHIVKNTLMSRAFEDAGLEIPAEMLLGTTAVGFATDDVPAVAKAIVDLARELGTVNLKGGYVDKVLYDAAQIERLADLPPLPVLRSQLLSLIQTPASRVALSLASSVRQIVNVTKAYADTETQESASAA